MKILGTLGSVIVAGVFCVIAAGQPAEADQTPQLKQFDALTPKYIKRKKFSSFTYSASGKTYVVYFKRDPLVRADKVLVQVVKGRQFTGTTADDREVQNMLRDAYRKVGKCGEGKHPGLLNFGYGPFLAGDVTTWSAHVRCSKKKQDNI